MNARMFASRLFRLPGSREDFLQLIAWSVAATGLFGITFLVEPNAAIALFILFFCLYLLGWVADAKNRKVSRDIQADLRRSLSSSVEGVRGELRGVDEALRGVVGEQVEGVRGELRGVDEALRGVVGQEVEKLSKRVQDWRKLDLAESYGVASSIAFLVSSIRPDNPLEFSRGWSATPELLAHIYHYIVTTKPKVVLDIGSGMSTLICGLAVEKSPETKVISWEHLPEYSEQTMSLLRKFGVEDHVDLQLRPLEPVDVEGTTYSWYAGPHSLGQKIDLLIVDGPPGIIGEKARYPAFPLLRKEFAKKATVLLDDVERDEESQVLHAWGDMAVNANVNVLLGGKSSFGRIFLLSQPAAPLKADS